MTTLIMSVFSAAFLGVGITIFYILLRNARTKSALRLNGQRVEASITHVKIDKSFNLNGEYPYRIYARWKNPVNNQTHNFQSEHIWFDPAPFMNGRTEVSVYIDAHNPDKHAVDLDFISTTTSV